MKKCIEVYKSIMTCIGILGLIGFIGSVLIQIIARTFLPTAPNWTEEAARFLFIFMVAFAGNAAIITDEYVGVELLTDLFPAKVRKIFKIAIIAAIGVFSCIVFTQCVLSPTGLLAITPASMVSTALELPMKWVYSSEVILFGFYIVSCIFKLYLLITDNTAVSSDAKEV